MRISRGITFRHILLPLILVIVPGSLVSTSLCAASGPRSWEVMYDNSNLTDAAAPITMGNTALLNVTSLGPVLGIAVVPENSGFTILSADGTRWRWQLGDSTLISDTQSMPLLLPGLQQGPSLYLDAKAVSELCRIPVVIDPASMQICFRRQEAVAAETQSEDYTFDGWRAFTIAKPAADRPVASRSSLARIPIPRPPTAYDRMNVRLGIGYVQGADFGMELSSSGKLAGGDLNFSAIGAYGNRGTRLRNTHLTWLDREGGRGVEAGDLYSDAWGLVQGARYTWRASGDHWPSLGMYLKTSRTDNPTTSLAYADQINVTPTLALGGEIATDKSHYLNVRYDGRPFQLFLFKRSLSNHMGENEGMFGSLSLTRSISLFYGTTSSTDSFGRSTVYRNVGLRLPLLKRCGLVLGQTEYEHESSSSRTRSVGLTVPLRNNVHLFVRYQKVASDRDMLSGGVWNLRDSGDSLLTSLSMFAGPRVHLDYQRSRYTQTGRTAYYEQLVTNYSLSPDTSIQVITGFPNLADTDVLRLRLQQRLRDNLSLTLDYGRLSPFQDGTDVFGKRGFMLMLRKTWPCMVPARGGKISGTVLDQLGQPVESITVRMGAYSAASDKQGRYAFRCVPTGSYKIAIADESVPADYKIETSAQQIKVDRSTEETVDFRLIPFGCILGRVFNDANGNRRYDPGEGAADVTVFANDRVTATDRDGRFGFYNLDPGKYTVKIGTELLDKRYMVSGPTDFELDLRPMESITNLEFRVEFRKKPIIFATLD
jgi:hypothetical protein